MSDDIRKPSTSTTGDVPSPPSSDPAGSRLLTEQDAERVRAALNRLTDNTETGVRREAKQALDRLRAELVARDAEREEMRGELADASMRYLAQLGRADRLEAELAEVRVYAHGFKDAVADLEAQLAARDAELATEHAHATYAIEAMEHATIRAEAAEAEVTQLRAALEAAQPEEARRAMELLGRAHEPLRVLLKLALDEGYASDPDYPIEREAIYQAQVLLADLDRFTVESATSSVSPCLANCGEEACQKGCVGSLLAPRNEETPEEASESKSDSDALPQGDNA